MAQLTLGLQQEDSNFSYCSVLAEQAHSADFLLALQSALTEQMPIPMRSQSWYFFQNLSEIDHCMSIIQRSMQLCCFLVSQW